MAQDVLSAVGTFILLFRGNQCSSGYFLFSLILISGTAALFAIEMTCTKNLKTTPELVVGLKPKQMFFDEQL